MSAALRWLVATTLGLVIGGFALHFPGSYGEQVGWSLAAAVFGLILGFMTGALVGIMQWASLLLPRRSACDSSWRWPCRSGRPTRSLTDRRPSHRFRWPPRWQGS